MEEAAVDTLRQDFSVLFDPTLVDRPEELLASLGAAKAILVRNRTQVRGDLLAAAPALQCVGRLGVGLDNIDVDACKARDVAVYPATGANDLSVAEYVITTALMLLRGAYLSTASVAAGEWPRQALIGREISGKTMGLVGFGSIAREVARRAHALGMSVAASDPFVAADDPAWKHVRRVSLDELLSISDVVSLHIPLTTQTRHIIETEAFARMKKGAVLINAARGGTVDEFALQAALTSGKISGAALDVLEEEPLTEERGAMFAGLSNVILTPHIAGVTDESNVRVSRLTANTVAKHLKESAS
jgi:(S)-sulfolactate dehydrogenase